MAVHTASPTAKVAVAPVKPTPDQNVSVVAALAAWTAALATKS